MRRFILAVSFMSGSILGQMAPAQTLVLEISQSDRTTDDNAGPTGIAIEGHLRPFARLGKVDLAVGLRASFQESQSLWLGAGLVAEAPLGNRWVIEGRLMPGYYDPGSEELDLGSDLQFFSSIGLGYPVGESSRVSVAVSHLSNGGVGDTNPGQNSIGLRLSHRF